MNDIKIQILNNISNEILNMPLVELRCKHVLNLTKKAKEIMDISEKTEYPLCNWGTYENRGNDFTSHEQIIKKMEYSFIGNRLCLCKKF